MLSIPAIAALEAAPPPEVQAPGVATGRMPLLAGAAFSLALGLGAPAGIGFVLGSGALVGVAALVGGALLGRLRFRSFQAPRAAAAALILASGGGMVAVGLAWF